MQLNEILGVLGTDFSAIRDSTGLSIGAALSASSGIPVLGEDGQVQGPDELQLLAIGPGWRELSELSKLLVTHGIGTRAVLLLAYRLDNLPTGGLISALVDAGTQAIALTPLTDRRFPLVLLVVRVDNKFVMPPGYQQRAELGPISDRQLLRLVDEHVIEGVVHRHVERRLDELSHALVRAQQEQVTLQEQVQKLRASLSIERDARSRLERSRAIRLSRASRRPLNWFRTRFGNAGPGAR